METARDILDPAPLSSQRIIYTQDHNLLFTRQHFQNNINTVEPLLTATSAQRPIAATYFRPSQESFPYLNLPIITTSPQRPAQLYYSFHQQLPEVTSSSHSRCRVTDDVFWGPRIKPRCAFLKTINNL